MAKYYDLAFTSQESWYWRAKCRDAQGNPLNLTGATVSWVIASLSGVTIASFASGGSTVAITDAVAGDVAINVPPSSHSSIVAGQYTYVLRVTLASTAVTDQITGNMTVDFVPLSPTAASGTTVYAVYSKADLAASAIALGFVNLISGKASGTFQWQAGNFSASVAGDPLQGVYVASSIGGFDATVGCWVRVTTSNKLRPGWFGAVCDGSVDDIAPLNAVTAMVRNSYKSALGYCTWSLDGEMLPYAVSDTVDWTGSNTLRGGSFTNCILIGTMVGKPVVDYTGSNIYEFSNIIIKGVYNNAAAAPYAPSYGVVQARKGGSNPEAGRTRVGSLTCYGAFSGCCVLNYGAEIVDYQFMRLSNNYPGSTQACLAILGSSDLVAKYFGAAWNSAALLARTGESTATGDLSCSNHDVQFVDARNNGAWNSTTIVGITQANPGVVTIASADMTAMVAAGFANGAQVYFRSITGMTQLNGKSATVSGITTTTFNLDIDTSAYSALTGSTSKVYPKTGPAVILGNVHHTTVRGYFNPSGNDGVLIDATPASGDGTRAVTIEGRVENGTPYNIGFAGNTATNIIRELTIKLDNSSSYLGFLHTTGISGGGLISLQDASISVSNIDRTPTLGYFADPANFLLNDADIYSASAAANNPVTAFAAGSSGKWRTFGKPPVYFGIPSSSPIYTVATLPSAASIPANSRAFVTDANATSFLSIVAGGGANKVPVVSDGTNWLIG